MLLPVFLGKGFRVSGFQVSGFPKVAPPPPCFIVFVGGGFPGFRVVCLFCASRCFVSSCFFLGGGTGGSGFPGKLSSHIFVQPFVPFFSSTATGVLRQRAGDAQDPVLPAPRRAGEGKGAM